MNKEYCQSHLSRSFLTELACVLDGEVSSLFICICAGRTVFMDYYGIKLVTTAVLMILSKDIQSRLRRADCHFTDI